MTWSAVSRRLELHFTSIYTSNSGSTSPFRPPIQTHSLHFHESPVTMFFIAHRERELTMHPSFFDSAATEKIREQLHQDLEGTIEGTLMIIQIIEIDEISEPMLVPGTGMAKYNVSYRALVWRPFRGEVVDGMVTNVVNNGFFVDVGGMNVFVSKAVCDKPWAYC